MEQAGVLILDLITPLAEFFIAFNWVKWLEKWLDCRQLGICALFIPTGTEFFDTAFDTA